MVRHPITYAMMLPWLLMYMIIILEVQKIGIYMYQSVTKNFANAVLHIREVHSGMILILPDQAKESGSIEGFKLNYRFYVG